MKISIAGYCLKKLDIMLDTALKVLGVAAGAVGLFAGVEATSVAVEAVFNIDMQLLPTDLINKITQILDKCIAQCFE